MNRKQIRPEHFEARFSSPDVTEGVVLLNDVGRKLVLSAYHERKQEGVIHPLLKDKVPLGLLPPLQARLLTRHLRGDLPDYVPYLQTHLKWATLNGLFLEFLQKFGLRP